VRIPCILLENPSNSLLYKGRGGIYVAAPMTLAAIDWLSISINLLLIVFVIVCLLMTLLILMQRPKQEGLGAAFGGGVTDQVFGASTTNVLQKGTVWLGSLFFILSLTLAVLVSQQNKQKSVVDEKKAAAEQTAVEDAPPADELKSLLAELPQDAGETAPADQTAPEEESTPQESIPEAPEAPDQGAVENSEDTTSEP